MVNLQALIEQREQSKRKMQAVLDRVEAEGRLELSAQEKAEYDKAKADYIAAGDLIDRQKEQDELSAEENRSAGRKTSFPRQEEKSDLVFITDSGARIKALSPKEKIADRVGARSYSSEGLSVGRAIVAMCTGDWSRAQAERKIFGLSETGGGSVGGYLVPEALSSEVIDMARSKSTVVRAGARTIVMPAATLKIVGVESDPTAQWRTEGSAITASEPTFRAINMQAQSLAALVPVTIELMEDGINMPSLIDNVLAAVLAKELDRACLLGAGVTEPAGLYIHPLLNEVVVDAELADYDDFARAIRLVEDSNGEAKSCIMAPRTVESLRVLKSALTGDYLLTPEWFQSLQRLSTTAIPVDQTHGILSDCSCAFIGDFSQLAIGMRTNLVIEASRAGTTTDHSAFEELKILIRAYLRSDVAVLRPTFFTKMVGIQAAA